MDIWVFFLHQPKLNSCTGTTSQHGQHLLLEILGERKEDLANTQYQVSPKLISDWIHITNATEVRSILLCASPTLFQDQGSFSNREVCSEIVFKIHIMLTVIWSRKEAMKGNSQQLQIPVPSVLVFRTSKSYSFKVAILCKIQ